MNPITYPARPTNGGDFTKALPLVGDWYAEPKYDGWRALLHVPSGAMFNRKGERLSIEKHFDKAKEILRDRFRVIEWLDVEALQRRHDIARGTLIVLDAIISTSYRHRRDMLRSRLLPVLGVFEKPKPDSVYIPPWYDRADLMWSDTRSGGAFYEGIVCKKADSIYPIQLDSPDKKFPWWIKYRFDQSNEA